MTILLLILRRLLYFLFAVGLLIGIVDYTNISFRSDKARQILIENLETVTGRKVSIDGDIYITVSLSPKLLVEQIHVRNINGFDSEDLITVKEARVEISLLPLLSGTLHLEEISAERANINLIKNKDGNHNWSFSHAVKAKEIKDDLKKQRRINRLSLGMFSLTNVTIIYKDESRDQIIAKKLERLVVNLRDINKPYARILGSLQGSPYDISFESDPLHSLASGQPWLLHGTGNIAGSRSNIEASIRVIENSVDSSIDINIKNVNLGLTLENLGFIAGQDAAADEVSISAKLHGKDLTALYKQAEIELQLLSGSWKLTSPETGQEKELSFNKISSLTSWNKPVILHLDGMIAGEVITLDFKTNRLLNFFDGIQKLDVDLVSNIAGSDITLNGTLDLPVKTKQFQLDISLKIKDLEKLNPIINTEFPPFNNVSLSGNLIANAKGFILRSARASIGDTQLQTTIVIETNLPKPLWMISINSRQIQLKDFSVDNHYLKQPDISTEEIENWKISREAVFKPLRRFEEIVRSPNMHLNLNVTVGKILSGEDILGKAQFHLYLRDNTFSLKNIDIEVPAGRITASVLLEIMGDETTGKMKLNVDKFDYGIAARIFNSEAKRDGIISTRVDLELGGNDFTRLLDHATGKIDIVLWPKNKGQLKILDLWATNLYLILLPEFNKKESKVNCLVGLMNLKDGKMKEEFFAIDTTKLWISGNFSVDFEHKHVELSLFPRSKTARLFALQTPIRVAGSFSDIKLLANPLDMAVAYISFITSPLHVPAQWIFESKPPEDGSAVCEQFFDREYVKNLNKELRRKDQEEIDEILDADY